MVRSRWASQGMLGLDLALALERITGELLCPNVNVSFLEDANGNSHGRRGMFSAARTRSEP